MDMSFIFFSTGFVTGCVLGFIVACCFKSGDDSKEDNDYNRDEEN